MVLKVRASAEEKAEVDRAAKKAGMSVASYMRGKLGLEVKLSGRGVRAVNTVAEVVAALPAKLSALGRRVEEPGLPAGEVRWLCRSCRVTWAGLEREKWLGHVKARDAAGVRCTRPVPVEM